MKSLGSVPPTPVPGKLYCAIYTGLWETTRSSKDASCVVRPRALKILVRSKSRRTTNKSKIYSRIHTLNNERHGVTNSSIHSPFTCSMFLRADEHIHEYLLKGLRSNNENTRDWTDGSRKGRWNVPRLLRPTLASDPKGESYIEASNLYFPPKRCYAKESQSPKLDFNFTPIMSLIKRSSSSIRPL